MWVLSCFDLDDCCFKTLNLVIIQLGILSLGMHVHVMHVLSIHIL